MLNFHVQARSNRVARILSPTAPSLRRYLNRGVISATSIIARRIAETKRKRRDLERSA